MGEITYSVSIGSTYTDLKGGATFTATITRDSTPPNDAYPVSADIRFTSLTVYSSREPYLQFGDYFTTAGQPQATAEFVKVNINSLSSSILDITSKTVTVTVKGLSSTVNAMNFRSSSATLVVQYEQSYSKSTATLSPTSLDAGTNMTVNFSNNNLSSLSHKVTWSFGSNSNTVTTSTGAASASYTIPLSWINAIPSAVSGTGTVTVATYEGSSLIGSSSYSFTLNVPSSVVPSIESITATRVDNSVPSSWGIYVQNRSGVTLTANNAAGSYGSTISSYKFSGSTSSTQTGNTLTISPITLSGTQTFSVSVTDSRGRSSNAVSCSISVTAYTAPTVTSAVAFRCTSSGTSDEEGTYAGVRIGAAYSTMGGKNSQTVSCQYQKVGATSWIDGQNSMTLDTTYVIGNGVLDINYTYHVRFQLTDTFGTVEKIVDVSTTQYTMFFRKGGTGVGIGKACERDYAVEINPDWGFYYGNTDLIAKINSIQQIVYSSSQPTGTTGMIWLKPKS